MACAHRTVCECSRNGALDALASAAGSLLAGLLVSRVHLVVLLDVQSTIYIACGVLALVFIRDVGGMDRNARAVEN